MTDSRSAPLASKEEIKEFFKETDELLKSLKAAQKKLLELHGDDRPDPEFLEKNYQLDIFIHQLEKMKEKENDPTPTTKENLQQGMHFFKIFREFINAMLKHDPVKEIMYGEKDTEYSNAQDKFIKELKSESLKVKTSEKKQDTTPPASVSQSALWQKPEIKSSVPQPKPKQKNCLVM